MRVITVVSFLFFAAISALGQAQNAKLKISHLTGDFYVYTTYNDYKGTPYPANGLYVVTNAGVVMIDCPWDSTQNQPLLDSIKAKHHKEVVMVIATHSHEDRTGGLDFLRSKGVKTYTSKKTDDISKITGQQRAEFLITKDTLFTIGQHQFQTYYGGEGHTPDNIVIWFEDAKVLYGGCLVKSTEAYHLGNLADANVAAWTATIKNIQQKFGPPQYVIPGHESWKSKRALQHTLRLIKTELQKKT
jgi:metallo-beta-lactamase class B